MITERLKIETKPHHEETERISYGDKIMSGALTLDEYKTLIIKNYLLHEYMENVIAESGLVNDVPSLEFDNRRKTASLINDLKLLGITIPSNYPARLKPKSKAEALGMMYVVEGATLGGAYILKALKRNPNIVGQVPEFNYYGVYGEEIGPKWKTFQQVLIDQVNTTALEDEAIEAAKKSFDLFKEVFTYDAKASS